MAKRYWLFKSEPDVFSLQDLKRCPGQTTMWEGVRNYQARNLLRDEVRVGDEVLFYHSRQDPMHVAGTCKVVRAAYPDPHQFDARSRYHDPKASREEPPWVAVDVKFEREFARPVLLSELKSTPGLEGMMLLKRGARLSIQPVAPEEWKIVLSLADHAGSGSESAPKEPAKKPARRASPSAPRSRPRSGSRSGSRS